MEAEMLVVRNAQLSVWQRPLQEAFLTVACDHVRAHFPQTVAQLSDKALRGTVGRALHRAARYGLLDARDALRFLNVCAQYSWEFDTAVESRWMQALLVDSGIGTPSDRIDALVKECVHRHLRDAENETQYALFLRAADRAAPSEALPVPDPAVLDGAEDWLAQQLLLADFDDGASDTVRPQEQA
jgi:hypothetical protein